MKVSLKNKPIPRPEILKEKPKPKLMLTFDFTDKKQQDLSKSPEKMKNTKN